MKTNVKTEKPKVYTHEGAVASRINKTQELRRSVMCCLLWEDQFYESGVAIADRLKALCPEVPRASLREIILEAKNKMHLRHTPLFLAREYARLYSGNDVGELICDVIQRADELAEFLAIYWKDGKCPIAKQVKRGLAKAFNKFNEYNFAKYNRDSDIKLRDVLFLCHAKPENEEKAKLFKKIVDNTLEVPNTWEVRLSSGENKRDVFENLMHTDQLGGLAFLRNLRNMKDAGVNKSLVTNYSRRANLDKILPFRFVAAARAVPGWVDVCDEMLLRKTGQLSKLPGKTIVVIDVSGSMYGAGNISKNSDMTRVEAAGALAAILRECCEDARLYATAGDDYRRVHATEEMPAYRGLSLVETVTKGIYSRTIGGGGIFLTQCLEWIKNKEKTADRIIVLTDEQDCDQKLNPDKADAFGTTNYIINVASYKNGIGYGKFTKIDGWSESVVDYIREIESV